MTKTDFKKNKTKDRSMLLAEIDRSLSDIQYRLRVNAAEINHLVGQQRGLKELRHTLAKAKREIMRAVKPAPKKRRERLA